MFADNRVALSCSPCRNGATAASVWPTPVGGRGSSDGTFTVETMLDHRRKSHVRFAAAAAGLSLLGGVAQAQDAGPLPVQTTEDGDVTMLPKKRLGLKIAPEVLFDSSAQFGPEGAGVGTQVGAAYGGDSAYFTNRVGIAGGALQGSGTSGFEATFMLGLGIRFFPQRVLGARLELGPAGGANANRLMLGGEGLLAFEYRLRRSPWSFGVGYRFRGGISINDWTTDGDSPSASSVTHAIVLLTTLRNDDASY